MSAADRKPTRPKGLGPEIGRRIEAWAVWKAARLKEDKTLSRTARRLGMLVIQDVKSFGPDRVFRSDSSPEHGYGTLLDGACERTVRYAWTRLKAGGHFQFERVPQSVAATGRYVVAPELAAWSLAGYSDESAPWKQEVESAPVDGKSCRESAANLAGNGRQKLPPIRLRETLVSLKERELKETPADDGFSETPSRTHARADATAPPTGDADGDRGDDDDGFPPPHSGSGEGTEGASRDAGPTGAAIANPGVDVVGVSLTQQVPTPKTAIASPIPAQPPRSRLPVEPSSSSIPSPPAWDMARSLGRSLGTGGRGGDPERISRPLHETRKTPEAAHTPRPEPKPSAPLLKPEEPEAKAREFKPPEDLTEQELAAWPRLNPKVQEMLERTPDDLAGRKELSNLAKAIERRGRPEDPALKVARSDPYQWAYLVRGGYMPAAEFGARLRIYLEAEPTMEPGFQKLGENVRRGRDDPEDITAAIDGAHHPDTENKSKVFWAEIKRRRKAREAPEPPAPGRAS